MNTQQRSFCLIQSKYQHEKNLHEITKNNHKVKIIRSDITHLNGIF